MHSQTERRSDAKRNGGQQDEEHDLRRLPPVEALRLPGHRPGARHVATVIPVARYYLPQSGIRGGTRPGLELRKFVARRQSGGGTCLLLTERADLVIRPNQRRFVGRAGLEPATPGS